MDVVESGAVVIRNSRRSYVLLLILCLAFCGLGVRAVASGDRTAAPWLGIAFFGGLGIPTAVYQIRDTRPRLVIDREGVMDRTLRVGVIPWNEIVGARLVSCFGQEFIALSVRDPRVFVERLSPFWRKVSVANKAITSSELNLNLSGLPIRGREMLALIEAAWERARKG